MSGKKIGIITINLNNLSGLKKTMQSVGSQTFDDFEYIVIDGQSTDGSAEYIQQYTGRLDSWISEPDSGVYNAMNKGIREAEAEYLLFLNSGDILFDTDILKKVGYELNSTSADIVYGNLRFDHGDGVLDFEYPDRLTFSYFYERSLGHPATFIKRSLFSDLGNYDEELRIAADWAFFIRSVCLKKASYKHIPVLVSVFNMDGMSNIPENKQHIQQEIQQVLQDDFALFIDDYQQMLRLRQRIEALENTKIYKFFKFFGFNEFR